MRIIILFLVSNFLTLTTLFSENLDIEALQLEKKEIAGEIDLQKSIISEESRNLKRESEMFKKQYGLSAPPIDTLDKIYASIEQELKKVKGNDRDRLQAKMELFKEYESDATSFLEKKKKAEKAVSLLEEKLVNNQLRLTEKEKPRVTNKHNSELKILGIYKHGKKEISIIDQCAVWIEKEKTLRVILTPVRLSSEEKVQIKKVKDPFDIPWKEVAQNPQHWKNEPYLTMEIVFTSNTISHEKANFFRIFEYGLQGGTSTIQATLGEKYVFEKISFDSTLKALKCYGKSEDQSWRINIAN